MRSGKREDRGRQRKGREEKGIEEVEGEGLVPSSVNF
jgi:hypothetical protein